MEQKWKNGNPLPEWIRRREDGFLEEGSPDKNYPGWTKGNLKDLESGYYWIMYPLLEGPHDDPVIRYDKQWTCMSYWTGKELWTYSHLHPNESHILSLDYANRISHYCKVEHVSPYAVGIKK